MTLRARFLRIALGVLATMLVPALASAQPLNGSERPWDLYGRCGDATSGFRSKMQATKEAKLSVLDIQAIVVLECKGFDGPGLYRKVACPTGSPYADCLLSYNDGAGNHVRLGILRVTAVTDPLGVYTGCPIGSTLSPKLDLVRAAGEDTRGLNGIVTLSCMPADGGPGSSRVACPTGPSPYKYCLQTHNDGSGNAVTIGVVESNGIGDPLSLYGDCRYDGFSGLRPKAALLPELGLVEGKVTEVIVSACTNDPRGFPMTVVTCSAAGMPALGMNKCYTGDDSLGNPLTVGVRTTGTLMK
jgi:hypothetical protein